MAELNVGRATHTSMDSSVSSYNVASKTTDVASTDETVWEFPEATQNIGYYKTIPELKKAVDALAMWTAGKGMIMNSYDQVMTDNIIGWGEDSFQSILINMLVVKKVIGDSFAEIIRNDKGTLINLKPITPESMRIIVGKNGIIKRYEQRQPDGNVTKFEPYEILHLCNDRFASEIHGTSVIDACKWVILARNEAMDTYRKILRRSLAMGVLYVDTDDAAKLQTIMTKYQEAVNKGEVLVLPKDTAELKDSRVSVADFLSWIQYLENFFYQAVGIPKIILGGSDQVSEGSNKMSSYNFEQVYMTEQKELETDLWNQLGIKLKFERPISLQENMQTNEAKNTSQTQMQPKDTKITGGRE